MTPHSSRDRLEELKHQAAAVAVDYVQSDTVIGLGTGSTSAHFLQMVGQRLQDGMLRNVIGVPTSAGAETLARDAGIPITTLEEHSRLIITIDGADEADPRLNVIKGGGGALLREKIVAQVSDRLVLIVDETKMSDRLGTHWPIPVEVIPFGWQTQRTFIEELGATTRVRMTASGHRLITDQGNMILDCDFGPIDDPAALSAELSQRGGIVEHGLFLGLADEIIVAGKDGIRRIERERP